VHVLLVDLTFSILWE